MLEPKNLLIVGMNTPEISKAFGKDYHIVIPGQAFSHLNFVEAFSATKPRTYEWAWWKAVELSAKTRKISWMF